MERQSLRSELREHFYRPLWGTKKQSPSSLDGVVRCFPSESPVGPLTRPTGLSRTQQLVIFNTLKVLFLPSFSKYNGGFALDRAIPLIGTSRWWTALLLRIKAQQCVNFGGPRLIDKTLAEEYGRRRQLLNQFKIQGTTEQVMHVTSALEELFGSRTSFDACIEADNAVNVRKVFSSENGTDSRWEGIGGRVEFMHKFDIYKLLVSCAFREKLQAQGGSLFLPALLSTEVISNNLHSPFHYRVGLHQILDVFPTCSDVVHECNNGIYFQGGFGIDGVLTLLKTPRLRAKKSTKQQRMDQMREAKLTDLSFDKSLSDSISTFDSNDWLNLPTRRRLDKDGDAVWPSADSVLEHMHCQTVSLQKSADVLSKATENVNEGKLKEFNRNLEKRFIDRKGGIQRAFLPSPHLKIGGLAGVVATFGFRKDGLERVSLTESGHASPAVRRRASLRWRSAFDDHPVKAFLGCSFSAQIGRMRRKLLSFTSALVQCECTVPIALEQTSLPRRIQSIAAASRRNLMIGNVPLRPLMNFSFTQQVFGPLRAKADYRVALESSYALGSMSNLNPGSAFLQQLQSIRPCVVDAQFGFDFVIPGTQGAVKFGGWYSPSKKEAMGELRLF